MKYALRYYQDCSAINDVDEIIIKYINVTTELMDFVKRYRDEQRIIAHIMGLTVEEVKNSIDIFAAAYTLHKNFAVMISYSEYENDILNIIELLKDKEIPYFFAEGIDTLDKLLYVSSLGVSDLYICGELGFSLKKIKEAYPDIIIRVIPNKAQIGCAEYDKKFRAFFILPRDISIYEDYVDVFEFDGKLDTQPALIRVYKKEEWDKNISLIIHNLGIDVDENKIPKLFGATRLGCGKRCAFNKCTICDSVQSIAKLMKERGYVFREPEEDL